MRGVDFESKGRPLTLHALRNDASTELLRHEIIDDMHAKAGSSTAALHREEGIKDAGENIRGQTIWLASSSACANLS
jgi:hypothetical protein